MTMPKQNAKAKARKTRTTLRISVKLAAMAPEELVQAEKDARQAVVINLWQKGRLSTREAAAELGLSYYDYIDLLGKKNIPVLSGEIEEGEVDQLVQDIRASKA